MQQFTHDAFIIGGFGHVGLPLGIALAEAGVRTQLFDIDASKKPMILSGTMPFMDEGAEPVLKNVIGKTLTIAEDVSDARNAAVIIICIGTPLDEYLNPKLLPILRLCERLLPHLTDDHVIALRSTVYPGTTRQLDNFLRKHGCSADLAFCPERIVQGQAIRELRSLPQVVAGMSERATERASALFRKLGAEIIVTNPEEAELTKIYLNAWRYIQFATANQFAMIAESCGADFRKIHHAMTHNYSRAKDFPRAGFSAGPCLLKDTMQLAAFAENNFQLGHAAMLVNEGYPQFILRGLQERFDLTKETVGILGMAFKADCDDIRDSLSYKMGKLLRFHGANVCYSDEFAKDPTFISKEELVQKSSIVILGVPHSAYRGLTIPKDKHLVDIWGFYPPSETA